MPIIIVVYVALTIMSSADTASTCRPGWSGAPDAVSRARARRQARAAVDLGVLVSRLRGDGHVSATPIRGVASVIADDFVPVRVDADRRPDVNDRYNLDGWPTTVLLTPSGEMLTGTTYLPADGLLAMLDEVPRVSGGTRSARPSARRDGCGAARAAARRRPAVEPDLARPSGLRVAPSTSATRSTAGSVPTASSCTSPRCASRSTVRRVPATRAIRDALTQALDAMADGRIRDGVDGGFFRYAGGREWMRPHTEKMLEDQAGLVELFLEAGRALERPDWSSRPRHHGLRPPDLAQPAERPLLRQPGRRRGVLSAVVGGAAAHVPPPHVDRTLFTDWTAQAVGVDPRRRAARDPSLSEFGGRALDRAGRAPYEPGDGLAHWVDGRAGMRGLLTDQVHAARALLALHEATANPTWSMMAEELMRTAMRTLWDDARRRLLRPAVGAGTEDRHAGRSRQAAGHQLRGRRGAWRGWHASPAKLTCSSAPSTRCGPRRTGYREQGLFGAPYALAVADVSARDRLLVFLTDADRAGFQPRRVSDLKVRLRLKLRTRRSALHLEFGGSPCRRIVHS